MAVDRTRFNFNGKTRLTKKALIYEIIKKYLDQNNDILIEKLKSVFSQKSDFNVDMFVDEKTYENFNYDRKHRYFEQPFILKNGEKVYLSTQWGGDVFKGLLAKIKNKLGYDIKVYGDIDRQINIHDTNSKNSENNFLLNVKNIILYGVPGVGKTHNIGKFIKLIENGKNEKEIFDLIKQNEQSNTINTSHLKEQFSFLTFHQSFGYEDFIEGFRPNESGDIVLSDGIFKRLCEKARKNLEDSRKDTEEVSRKVRFQTILEQFLDEVEDEIADKGSYKLTDNVYIFEIENDALRYKGDNWTIHSTGIRMRFDILEKLYISNVHSRKDVKQVEEIGGLAKQHATYFWKVLEKIYNFEREHDIQIEQLQKVERKNYYLVIDEINRGNISKIFGELITLIEEDKRDTYEVTLPYSKEKFSVPSNLYIIGTMNSTDKSIALIDVALRRRFTFLKMEPNLELINYDKAKEIFKTLNEKLRDKLGEDHLIGHSYFMNIENNDDLEFVLEYKIKPLLEEYFYGDENGLDEVLSLIT